MTTIRVAKRDRYVAIARAAINDDRLSFRARGILAWLLDKPDDWTVDAAVISRAGSEGRDAVRAALNELDAAGYLRRTKRQADNGRWFTESFIYEKALVAPETGFQASADPASDDPSPVDQRSVDPALDKRLRPKTETEQPSPGANAPDDLEIQRGRGKAYGFDELWELYPPVHGGGKPRKADALKKWKTLDAKTKAAAWRGAKTFAARQRLPDAPYPPALVVWLNGARWEDVVVFPAGTGPSPQPGRPVPVRDMGVNFHSEPMPDDMYPPTSEIAR